MKNYKSMAENIIKEVGGKENVISVAHCATRLRFNLKDESIANDERIKQIEGVVTIIHTVGQYQVVIGNAVPQVYEKVADIIGINKEMTEQNTKKMKPMEKVLDLITGIMTPIISLLCACGLLKGILSILSFTGVLAADSGLYILLNAVGDSVFNFFPVLLGYTTAKKVNMSPFIGMAIGLALCMPTIQKVDLTILGYTFNLRYTYSVLPVIFIVLLSAPFERWLRKVLPEVIRSYFTPLIVMTVMVPLGYLIIGPVANQIGTWISNVMLFIYNISPVVAGALIGGLWQILVVFGVHSVLTAVGRMTILSGSPDPILAIQTYICFAQMGVVFAIWLKTRDKKLKSLTVPAWTSAFFGITEPAIYGITLPRIKMFIISCLGGSVSGGLAAFLGLKMYSLGGMGIFAFTTVMDPNNPVTGMIHSAIIIIVTFIAAFIPAYLLYKNDDNETNNLDEGNALLFNGETLSSPAIGKVKPLEQLKDEAFSSGAMGKGIAIEAVEGKVYAPVDGKIVALFPTKHAVGIMADSGCEILIHIGVDTVNLNGEYFENHIKQNDYVKKGDLLIEFDLDEMKKMGYCTDVILLVTNFTDNHRITYTEEESVTIQNKVLEISL